ncbi:MAG: heavy metal translocating P-type ATPase [Lachnospiraceae bacterium]|jgi:Cu+-exporting ATPase|nr:heavy metal translocating P-type ATPase [Lachnospiraceae bacterium]
MIHQSLTVKGMGCAVCQGKVEKALKSLDGISNPVVNLNTEQATFDYDPDKVSLSDVDKAVTDAGYSIEENVSYEERKIKKKIEQDNRWKNFRLALIFTIILLIVSMGPMLFAPVLSNIGLNINPLLSGLLQIILTIPVMIIGKSYYKNGFSSIMHFAPNMDALIAISTSAAFIYSTVNLIILIRNSILGVHTSNHNDTHFYYESVAVIITLIMLGKTLEASSKGKTLEAIGKLIELSPKTAHLQIASGEEEVSIKELKIGDIILIKPGEKIPLDGKVIKGASTIDESMLTGESLPVNKAIDSMVYQGTINTTGSLEVSVTKTDGNTVLSDIITYVEEASGTKAPIAKLADKIAGVFVPIVCLIALISGIAWFIYSKDLGFALKIFISVLVISCPCSLGLATPTAIMVATGNGARNGILIRNGETLELAGKIQKVVFDKTGTITKGLPHVTDILTLPTDIHDRILSKEELLQIVASVEKYSEHPLGKAIVREFADNTLDKNTSLNRKTGNYKEFLPVSDFTSITGEGVLASLADYKIKIGSDKVLDDTIQIDKGVVNKTLETFAKEGKTVLFVLMDNKLIGLIALADEIKESSSFAIKALKDMNITPYMITGDNEATASLIATSAGIENTFSNVLPKDKAKIVEELQEDKKIVAMVGDGINDAPALVTSDVGIAIGNGTDIAIESADIVLMHSDLIDVKKAIYLSKKTMKNIKENLFWAFCYNVIGIPFAAGVFHIFGGPLLNPMIAAACMSLSSLCVVTNALRLRKLKL